MGWLSCALMSAGALTLLECAVAAPALAQQPGDQGRDPSREGAARARETVAPGDEEIVVTAQKREQSPDDVGMAITAATGEVLRDRGIRSVADLPKLVPGLTLQESNFNSTSLTLRGVGFFNSDLATPPAVTIYLDEAPLPYPAMTRLAAFDLERVEVLKGPQGTLFGQNATGGAVNYIAAKPTEAFAAGADATYGRFNRVELGGFVSGPLGDQLSGRLALYGRRGDAWQRSITRPGDRLGKIREYQGRATVEWRPGERYRSRLTLTATHDRSESLAGQFIAPNPVVPALVAPGLLTFPVVTRPRSADWSPTRVDTGEPFPYSSDTSLFHLSWRNDFDINADVTMTALSSYARFRLAYGQDPNGTPFTLNEVIDTDGRISALYQEVRLAGRARRLSWLVGGNASRDRIEDRPLQFFRDVDLSRVFESVDPTAISDANQLEEKVRVNTYAVFGRLEYALTQALQVEGAARYNIDRRTFDSCARAATESFARYWNLFRGGAQPPTRVGDCIILDPANAFQPVQNVHSVLNEDSVSWRVGLNWTARPDLLIFANVSKGYKSGTVPVLATAIVTQLAPIRQESVVAYEAGLKARFLNRRAQLNASAFYYDYKDKQLRGALLDVSFGPLEALVSVPKSHVVGAEAQLLARPIDGLTIDTSATYVHTRIDSFTGFDGLARFGDQAGTPFPFAPKWQSVTNVDYEFSVSPRLRAFVGGGATSNSHTFAGVGARDAQRLRGYTLLDIRAGLETGDGRYRVWLWGRNVTNTYYWTNVFPNGNVISRFVGQPATFGISFSTRH